MRKRRLACLVVLAMLPAIQTEANPVFAVAPDSPAQHDEQSLEVARQFQIGILAGGSEVGDVDGPGIGAGISAGLGLADLSLLGELDFMETGESGAHGAPRRGLLWRAGLAVRYEIGDLVPAGQPIANRVWLEAGAGRQRVVWQGGGTLTRNDLVLGLGFQLGQKSTGSTTPTTSFGPYFAIRAVLARAPDTGAPAMPSCGGPCDTPGTPARPTDVGTFFSFGMHWGDQSPRSAH